MAHKHYDPLDFVPSPEIIRQKLTETQSLADRLSILLELAERLRLPLKTADGLAVTDHSQARGGNSFA